MMTDPDKPASQQNVGKRGLFLGQGLRPFFCFAGLFAVIAMLSWIAWLGVHFANGVVTAVLGPLPMYLWHAHELVFGYIPAVLAGFLLTAVPNWTNSPGIPVRGQMLLACAWLLGRCAMAFGAGLDPWLIAALDMLFLPILAVMISQPLWKRRAKRNFIFPVALTLFAAFNLYFHAESLEWTDESRRLGLLLAIDLIILLLVVVGGRVTPAFTRNALRNAGETDLPRSFAALDVAAIASIAILLIADSVASGTAVSGAVALIAAVLQILRLAGWRSWATRHQPIVWVLHLGYGWIALGLVLKGMADLGGPVPDSAALHGLTIGAMGTMTVGVMSRAALGHTGYPLIANGHTVAAYCCIAAAPVPRIFGPWLFPGYYAEAMLAAALLWIAGFALFCWVFIPLLTSPRRDGQPG